MNINSYSEGELRDIILKLVKAIPLTKEEDEIVKEIVAYNG